MSKPTTFVMVGAGGYAAMHVKNLLDPLMASECTLVAIVDPFARNSSLYPQFKDLVPIYDSLEAFYAVGKADVAFIATPIHLHLQQCITAMENGSHVLCEKPLVPTMAEWEILKAKTIATGKTLAVAFQWCHSHVMQGVKKRILAGEFGAPLQFKTYVSWPRGWKYFARSWAGKIATEDGRLIHDSVLTNATAHYLQNTLFLLGDTMVESATLTDVETQCYRVNPIETFDTIALKGKAAGAEVFFTASHATNYKLWHPAMDYTFEKARILTSFAQQDGLCVIHHGDGRVEELGSGVGNGLWDRIAYTAQSAKGLRPWCCTIDTVKPFTQLIDHVFSHVPVQNFPEAYVVHDNTEELTYVKQLHLDLMDCYHAGKLPTEMGFGWC